MPRNIKTLEPTDNSLVQVFITCKTLTLTLILIQFLRKHQKFSNLSNKKATSDDMANSHGWRPLDDSNVRPFA